eukprot:6178742-Pleurochrysis_carterae.AAC.2
MDKRRERKGWRRSTRCKRDGARDFEWAKEAATVRRKATESSKNAFARAKRQAEDPRAKAGQAEDPRAKAGQAEDQRAKAGQAEDQRAKRLKNQG